MMDDEFNHVDLGRLWNDIQEDMEGSPRAPSFDQFLEGLDESLMGQIRANAALSKWYDYFDDEKYELNPREFLQYWGSLTNEEKLLHKIFSPADLLRGK